MARRAPNFVWDDEELRMGLDRFDKNVMRAIIAATDRNQAAAVAWMKSNAPWTDQTGNARNGLMVRNTINKNGVTMTFSHSVPYGIFLEVRHGGRYAVVGPAIREWFPRTMTLIYRLI